MIVVFSIVGLDKLRLDDPSCHLGARYRRHLGCARGVPVERGCLAQRAALLGIVMIFGWVAITSAIVWGALKATVGIRVSEEEEFEGVDIGECGLGGLPRVRQG